jgi:hypothetical protein
VLGPLPDGRYIFEVAGVDGGRRDRTPASRAFTIQSSGPSVEIAAHPPRVQTGSSASFAISIQGNYSRTLCRLTPTGQGPWGPCDDLAFDGLPEGDWVFEAMAENVTSGEWTSPPAAWPFRVDATGPVFTLARRPPPATTLRLSSTIAFAANERTDGPWVCSLDGRGWDDCSNGRTAVPSTDGGHTLAIRAVDAIGNVGVTTFRWTIDRVPPPEVRFMGTPSDPSTEHDVTIALVSSNDALYFLCALDGRPRMPCRAGARFDGLPDGPHTLMAWAVDAAGNRSEPATFRWRIISAGPSG